MAAHNTFWVSPEQKIDRLIKQLAESQAEVAVLALEADKSKARIAELESLLGEAETKLTGMISTRIGGAA